MDDRTFYASRIWKPILWLGVFGGFYGSFVAWNVFITFPVEFPLLSPLLCLGSLLVAIGSGLGLWQIRRPVLEISEERLEHTWIMTPGRKRITASEVAGIAKSTPRRTVITTRKGDRVSIRVDSLPREQRNDARGAIERWVAVHGTA